MPTMAMAIPKKRYQDMTSPKKNTPPVRMMTVLRCPMMLYERLLVEPITRKVERLTRMPRTADRMMAATASTVKVYPRRVPGSWLWWGGQGRRPQSRLTCGFHCVCPIDAAFAYLPAHRLEDGYKEDEEHGCL